MNRSFNKIGFFCKKEYFTDKKSQDLIKKNFLKNKKENLQI